MRVFTIFLSVLVATALFSCNGSKAFVKRAVKLEAAGLTHEAANNYYIALQKNRTNVDAQIGMKSTGQLVLNDKLNDFSKDKNFGKKKDAVYAFHAARDYHKKIKSVGVELTMADFYEQDYEDVKSDYMAELYEEGTTLLEASNFKDAERIFDEISRLDPNFKDANALKDIAYLEPLYKEGVASINGGRYRAAHDNFSKVVERKADYKDAKKRLDECVQLGRFTMAVLPFQNATNSAGLDAKIGAYLLDALTGINDPFLKIVDRDNLNTILEEQKLGLTGVIDEETAVNVGELIGAHAIFTGTVLSYDTRNGKLSNKSMPGYEQYTVKKYNAEEEKYYNETKYRKTNYQEYFCTNEANVSFQYKVISLKTGEVILSKIIDKRLEDNVHYAKYDGDVSTLYPSNGNAVNHNRASRDDLRGLFNARQQPISTSELSNNLFQVVSDQLQADVASLLRQTIQ